MYNYAVLKAVYPASLTRQIQEFVLNQIKDEDLYRDPKEEIHGREMKSHITLLYGIQEHRPNVPKIQQVIQNHPAMNFVEWLGLGKFESEDYDVLLIQIKSQAAQELFTDFNNIYPDNANSYPNYVPHTTLAYLKKGAADSYIQTYGEAFQDPQVAIKWIRFSYNENQTDFLPATGEVVE